MNTTHKNYETVAKQLKVGTYCDRYKDIKKIIIPLLCNHEANILKTLIPDINDIFLEHLLSNGIESVTIRFSGTRVSNMVNIFFNYNFPSYMPQPRIEDRENQILSRIDKVDKLLLAIIEEDHSISNNDGMEFNTIEKIVLNLTSFKGGSAENVKNLLTVFNENYKIVKISKQHDGILPKFDSK